jgi:uncharacterized protein (DUF2461 family)
VWHPDNRALTKIRSAIVREPEQWAKVSRKLELEGDSLTRPPRGFNPEHQFIEDIKRKDFVASVAFTDVSGNRRQLDAQQAGKDEGHDCGGPVYDTPA